MKYLIGFIASFLIVYLFYLITVVLQKKKYEKFRSSNQVMFFVNKYKLNAKKINISKFIKIISLTNSLVIAMTFTVILPIKNIYLELLVGLLVLIPLMLITYNLIGNYLKKECK